MEIIDKHFLKLPKRRQTFIMIIIISYFVIGLLTYLYQLATVVESLFIFIIGLLFSELVKMQYRVEALENRKRPKG